MPSRSEFHVAVSSPESHAVELLHSASMLSRQKIKAAMTKGAVWVTRGKNTQRLRRASRKLELGDEIHLYYDESVLSASPPPPDLVKDAGAYTIWRKPYGLRSQGSKWGDHCTVVRWAEQNLVPQRSGFTVHRLDRAASGLVIVAHSKKVAAALSKLFQDRQVEKRYRAVVAGDFSGLANPLRVTEPIEGKAATTEIAMSRFDNGRSYLDVRIETGRKHQIRRHLAGLGFPIVGDRLYGKGSHDDVDLQLTASFLGFTCPVTGRPVEFQLP